jgi:cobyrinic acid a,c-diamide synthase
MAQTAAAVASGLVNFRDDVQFAGLIANNCGSERHRQLIEDALPDNLPLLAHLARSEAVVLPERHLGLVQASEVEEELENRLNASADWLEQAGLSDLLERLPKVKFHSATLDSPPLLLSGHRIAVARDEAFSFIYDANLRLLKDMGAELVFFSPIHSDRLPDADALWLPGGYPELHAQSMASNQVMIQQIQAFYESGKAILAECGGFLYCLETLTDLEEQTFPMLGLLNGHGAMRGKRGCQGMQAAPLPEGEIRAHAHHRSRSSETDEPIAHGRRQRHPAPGEAIYRSKQLTASYLHLFFPSNPNAVAKLFKPA